MKEIGLDDIVVTDNANEGQFEAEVDGALAVAEYARAGDRIIFTHTEVPEAYRGQGIGEKLVRTALEKVRAEGLTVRPFCPFVRSYIEDHPEFHDLVSKASRR